MKKIIVYVDMDGTIADLYNQHNWLEDLRGENVKPFIDAKPIITEEELFKYFPKEFYDVRVFTMTPMDASDEYHKMVIEAKNKWLDKYFPTIEKRIYRKFGDNKNLKNTDKAILVDDNEKLRDSFRGASIDPKDIW